ncbi:MAG: fimbrillin family protein [Bacteroidales bacterium]|nr:fimbrillin family protein [Bacteroidales bacterium]
MKKILLVALATMSLVSCSNDEVMEIKQDVISFDAVTDNASRAATNYSSSEKPETFIVYAVHTDSEGNKKMYIPGVGVTKKGEKYDFSNGETYYWPGEGTLTFYAIVPPEHYISNEGEFDPESGVTNQPMYRWYGFDENLENPQIAFVQPFVSEMEKNAPEYGHDLIYAVKAGLSKPAADAINKTVTLNFRHACAQLVINAINTIPNNIYVEISSVSFWGTVCDGRFSLPNESTDANVVDNNGVLANQGTWTSAYNLELYQIIEGLNIKLADDEYVDVAVDEKAIMAIPFIYQADDDNDETTYTDIYGKEKQGLTLCVNYKVYNISDPTKGYQEGVDALMYDYSTTAKKFPLDATWEQGKKYIYTLKFGDLEPISLDITVDNFIDGSTKVVSAEEE